MTNSIQTIFDFFLKSKKVSTDSRNIPKGAVFFALHGDNFNGNEFAQVALENGAAVAVVDDDKFINEDGYIVVKDTLFALQELANLYRKSLKAQFIGITGSNGKTTSKELIREVLSSKYKTQATVGNFNNHIGVPLTILSLSSDLDFAIIEMGANHIGEIAALCEIAQPDFGLITNIGKAHLEGFGGFEGVIKAKSELYKYMDKVNGPVFINSDNGLLNSLSEDLKKITYGKNPEAYCAGEVISSFPFLEVKTNKKTHVSSNLVGIYNFENVMASICIGKYFGVDDENIKAAIESFRPDNNRSQVIKTDKNTLILDAYNANPTSMEAAINSFSESSYNNKILILGEMLELGSESKKEHRVILELALNGNFEQILLSGNEYAEMIAGKNILMFENSDKLASYLKLNRVMNKTILVKGSRGNRLEKIQKFL